ncbi:LuxE/PaaK family acyltransferase [Microscilla marina]|uniref:Acyl-protein synthetase LuxE domain-containing protein n=1 Tax=Microscilla marina ATCC 23134 TaxID=313606 RepID=A1ZQF0_MICM2|nr:acyltransferase [Microscilla marina]EAY27322.1 hypothetical protein M23134_08274 [Microscilla marina ATCC 23134]
MKFSESFKNNILQLQDADFEQYATELFHYQVAHNAVYKEYVGYLSVKPAQVKRLADIPFLPVELFKSHQIISGNSQAIIQKTFESSATTMQTTSKHHVLDLDFYRKVSQQLFEQKYGALTDFHVLALLPSYLERNNSSLVYMVQHFIEQSQSPESDFFLHNTQMLVDKLKHLQANSQRKILLIGVTFALLDLAEAHTVDLSEVILMETGGMKGRRKEMLRSEVHKALKERFGVAAVHSEYGMTELLSQAYSSGHEEFDMPTTMRILLRDVNDPLYINNNLRYGAINIIDLANVDSCAFIATQDLGKVTGERTFQVLGRLDNSDIRGCNLLVV